MAERLVNRITQKMEEDDGTIFESCTTDKIPLCGNDFKKFKHVKKYIEEIYQRIQGDGFSEYDAWYLVTTYGKQTEVILENYASLRNTDNYVKLIRAEAQFSIAFEMASNPLDFFIRRTGRLYFDIDSVRTYLDPVMDEFKKVYSYDNAQMQSFKNQIEKELESHSNFSLERI